MRYDSNRSSPDSASKPPKNKILMIGDHLLNLQHLRDQFPSDRFEVHGVEQGLAALKMAETIGPDLILLDPDSSQQNGADLYRALRNQPNCANTPILVMSSNPHEILQKFGLPHDSDALTSEQASPEPLSKPLHETLNGHSNAVLSTPVSKGDPETAALSVTVAVQDIVTLMSQVDQLERQLSEQKVDLPPFNNGSGPNDSFSEPFLPNRQSNLLPRLLIIAAIPITALILYYSFTKVRQAKQQTAPPLISNASAVKPPTPKNIAALGKLEPKGEITRLSAPNSLEGSRIAQVFVKEGDRVSGDQVVATLDSQSTRLASWKQAQANVATAQARLAKVKAGAKVGDIDAQRATITRLTAEREGGIATQKAEIARIEAELNNAQVEYDRYLNLYNEGAIAKSALDTRELRLQTAQKQLNEAQSALSKLMTTVQAQKQEAQATLGSIKEIRPVDIQLAESEVNSAIIAAQQAKAELDLTSIRAPIDGTILSLNVRAGEVVGSQGIATIGQTDRMYVVAEIYETDIKNVHPGQEAVITSDALSGKLTGKVDHIGLQVNKQGMFDVNPLAKTDYKVVEVKIRLDSASSQRVANLSNLQVQVIIKTKSV